MNRTILVGLLLTMAGSVAAAQVPAERQIELAVQAAPERMRADASVLGYDAAGKLVTLRKGTGLLICLADDPKPPEHHVSCYHKDLDPYMARGRELRAAGKTANEITTIRMAEIKAGKLKLPAQPAALYQLIAPAGSVDATGPVRNAKSMYVVYTPYATEATTGISARPLGPGQPWIMDPGLPWAHIMITP